MGVQEVLKKLHFNASKSAVIAEFIGTFLFTLTIPLSQMASPELAPLSFGFMLMALVFSYAYLSGGHFNPAITLGVFLCRDKPKTLAWHRAVLYAIAQCSAALLAAFYCVLIHGAGFPVPVTRNEILHILRNFLAESVFTFVLVSVVLHVACSRQRENQFYGFAIGMACMSASLAYTEGAFNPAVATGLLVMKCLTGTCMPVLHLWLYWGADVVGALVAAILYNLVADAIEVASKPADLGIDIGTEDVAPIRTEIQLNPPRAVTYDDNDAGSSGSPTVPAAKNTNTSSSAAPAIRPPSHHQPPTATGGETGSSSGGGAKEKEADDSPLHD